MSTSIFNIQAWASATLYSKHDIVTNGDYHYYALTPHTSGPTFAGDAAYWGGVTTDENGATKTEFIWTPSYNSTVNNQPKVKAIQFGDGYEQRIQDGINNVLLEIDFAFESRGIAEATAILHFLYTRQGVEPFMYSPPPPYNRAKRFVCPQWGDTANFFENISVRAKFKEVVA